MQRQLLIDLTDFTLPTNDVVVSSLARQHHIIWVYFCFGPFIVPGIRADTFAARFASFEVVLPQTNHAALRDESFVIL